MPDTYWPDRLSEAEARVSGDNPYHTGWSACMEWQDRQPPDTLDADARELWFRGFDDAMDAPFGSGPEIV